MQPWPASEFVSRLKGTLDNIGTDYESAIKGFGQVAAFERRLAGEPFELKDHIRGLVFALLSNQRPWGPIERNKRAITSIFYGFEPEKILAVKPDTLIDDLRAIRCGNRAIRNQMMGLRSNIAKFEDATKEFGSMDRFVMSADPWKIATELSSQQSKYKLRSVGPALALEYLRNVGIRASKPDLHVRRLLGSKRLGYIKAAQPSEKEAYFIIDSLATDVGSSSTYLDNLLWIFCAVDYGNVCGASPKCDKCLLNERCARDRP